MRSIWNQWPFQYFFRLAIGSKDFGKTQQYFIAVHTSEIRAAFLISYKNKTRFCVFRKPSPAVSGIFLVCGDPEWERNCFYLFICMNPVTIWLIAWKENLPPLLGGFVFVCHGSTEMHVWLPHC